jgi:hypothetical protein
MKRLIWLVILELLGFAVAASAQSLSPLTGEGGHGRLKGSFTISNPEVIPMTTTVDVRSVSFAPDGTATYSKLDPAAIVVHITDTSAKIGPRQSHVFYYDVECKSFTSCTVAFLPGSVFGRATSGMQVKVVLPHVVYLCQQGAKDCRVNIRRAAGIVN